MISFNFEYFQAKTVKEAISLFIEMNKRAKKTLYIAGGTELLTLGRTNQVVANAVIDLKDIPECNVFEENHTSLIIGSCLTLNQIQKKERFPLLDQIIHEIADHTSRNKITLGGNICAKIIYQEALLPFLLTDSLATIASKNGIIEKPIQEVFNQGKKLATGEILLSLRVPKASLKLPYFTVKKRRQWNAGYPLMTIAAIKKDKKIQLAFSGLTSFAFRSFELEQTLNDTNLNLKERISKAIEEIPFHLLEDIHGSAPYRKFVLQNCLFDILNHWKEGLNNE